MKILHVYMIRILTSLIGFIIRIIDYLHILCHRCSSDVTIYFIVIFLSVVRIRSKKYLYIITSLSL